MELKITTEKVKAAAAKCPQANVVLREMFPEAFPHLAAFTGQVYVEKIAGEDIGLRTIATTYEPFLKESMRYYDYPHKPVAIVFASSSDNSPNCWPIKTWDEFSKYWKIVR